MQLQEMSLRTQFIGMVLHMNMCHQITANPHIQPIPLIQEEVTNTQIVSNGNTTQTQSPNKDEEDSPDVEIIGVEHANIDGEHDSIIGTASINGQAVYFIDVDGEDNEFELMVSDTNGNNQVDEGEVVDISEQHMSVEEIRKRLETASVVGADETGATVGKHLHWNWIFQNDLLTYVFQSESRGQKAIDSKFPKGLPYSTLVTDRHQSYFKMIVKDHQVCLAPLLRNAEYLNELIQTRTGHGDSSI